MPRLLLLGVLLVSGALTPARAGDVEKLSACLGEIRSLSANFQQHTQEADASFPLQLEGKLYLRAPYDARWEVLRPYRETLLYDGTELWHYERDLEQVRIQALSPASVPLLLLLDPERSDWRQRFDVRREQTGEVIVYHVAPLPDEAGQNTPPAPFIALRATFEACRPRSVWWRDSLGRQTRIELSRLRVNPKLSERRFHLRIPSGTDVVREP